MISLNKITRSRGFHLAKSMAIGIAIGLSIDKNGKFGYATMPSSRSVCNAKGTLTFGQGIKRMLFK